MNQKRAACQTGAI